jgi:sodium transport system ATP-binding protein
MIVVEQVAKRFADVVAVAEVSLSAADGAITAVLGPNGAGKTTTLRMVTALIPPDRGRVLVDGIDASADVVAARRRIGALPHAHGLYPRLTSREHVDYFARLHGLDRETTARRTEQLFSTLQMHDIADRRTEGFSQGQKLKVALARALVHEPQNLVLDEPTAGLDVTGIRAMRAFLLEQKSAGRCVVFSTHVMQEVVALADHIVIVAAGRVTAQGSLASLREQAGHDDLEEVFARLVDPALRTGVVTPRAM